MAEARYRTKPATDTVVAAMTPGTHKFYLTRRQAEVLYWLSLGVQLTDVGDVMGGISYNTAKTTSRALYRRMQVKNAAEAIRVGFETGILVARTGSTIEGQILDGRRDNVPVRRVTVELSYPHGGQSAQEDQRIPGPDDA